MVANSIVDPVLGELTWDPELHEWRGISKTANGVPFSLVVRTPSDLTQRPPFDDKTWDRTITPEARDALARVLASEDLVRTSITQEFFPQYSRWPDREAIDSATFARRIRIEAVSLLYNGAAEVYYDDSGFFGGHALIAHLDPHGVVTRTELFG